MFPSLIPSCAGGVSCLENLFHEVFPLSLLLFILNQLFGGIMIQKMDDIGDEKDG